MSSTPAFVIERARAEARWIHDPHPSLAEYVLTDRQAANQLDSDERVDSDNPVYLLVMRGKFVDTKLYAPSGAPNPRGNQIEITVDARTGGIMDFGLLNRPFPPALSTLGTVHYITTQVFSGAVSKHQNGRG